AAAFVAEQIKGKRAFGTPVAPTLGVDTRRDLAASILPAIRGELNRGGWRCVLHLDNSPETLDAIGGEKFAEVAGRGVMTPEHILRAGVRPLIVTPDVQRRVGARQPAEGGSPSKDDPQVASPLQHAAERILTAVQTYRAEYAAYAKHHGHDPVPDFL